MPQEAEYCDGARPTSEIGVFYSLERQGSVRLVSVDVMGAFRFCELGGRAGLEPIGDTGSRS